MSLPTSSKTGEPKSPKGGNISKRMHVSSCRSQDETLRHHLANLKMAQDSGLRRIGNRIVIPPKDAADLLGVSRTTIYDLAGLERSDSGGVYLDSLLTVHAKRQKSETPASLAEQWKEARARKAIADADKSEIERDYSSRVRSLSVETTKREWTFGIVYGKRGSLSPQDSYGISSAPSDHRILSRQGATESSPW